jgi:glycosyltransferase involved in cell wall biosynthesis
MDSQPTYVFFTWEEISYSRTGVIFSGMGANLVKPVLNKIALGSVWSMMKQVRSLIKSTKISNPVYIVGSPCGILVLSVRLAAPKSKIVFDSGWPQIDALMSRKNLFISRSFKLLKMYVLDLLSFHFSSLIALESNAQLKRVRKRFFIKKNRLFVSYTGLNEFHFKTIFQKNDSLGFKNPIVLFRGKFNHEAGLEILAGASWLIPDDISLIIICPNLPKDVIFSPRSKVITERISEAELVDFYCKAYLAIGQLGNSKRTAFTIPHKFFEAAYFKVPYLTKKTEGILELLPENEYGLFCDSDDPKKIAKVISQFAYSKDVQELNSALLTKNYQSRFSQEILARNFNNQAKRLLKI